MYRIFNERKYIETYIKKGFQDYYNLNSDMQLYVRWLKLPKQDGGEGHQYDKKECKEKLLNKLKKIPYYNIIRNMKTINRNIDTAWKNKRPLLNIEQIPVTYATMNWFKTQGLRKNEIKLLFTIYMGYRIKQHAQNKEYCVYFDEIKDMY